MTALIDALPAPAESLDEAKAYLRLESSDEDAVLARLVGAATRLCEEFTGLVLIARTAGETIPIGPEWRRLSLTPVRAITGVDGLTAAGDTIALPADGYAIDIDAHGDGWVRVTAAGAATRVTVHYAIGLAEGWSGLPEAIRQGVSRLAAHFYSHRDDADEGAPPAAVAALWRPWRRMRLR
jgi:uncharacterized phiE125 gp8 family phage protein